jgi:hypothetical protein
MYRLFDFSRALFEYREWPNSIRQFEPRRLPQTAIELESLPVQRLRQVYMAHILMDVTQMANRVCQLKSVVFPAAEGDRFLVQRSSCVGLPPVSFDLAEPLERLYQLAAFAGLSAEGNCLSEAPMRVGQSILTPSLAAFL